MTQQKTKKQPKNALKTIGVYVALYLVSLAFVFNSNFGGGISGAILAVVVFYVIAILSAPVLLVYHFVKFFTVKDYIDGRYHLQIASFFAVAFVIELVLIFLWMNDR